MRIGRAISAITVLIMCASLVFPPNVLAQTTGLAAKPDLSRHELVEMRTAHRKVFQTPQGLEYDLFMKPINMRDQNGAWDEVNARLEDRPSGDHFAAQTAGAPYTVSFTDKQDRNEIEFRNGQGAVRFTVEGAIDHGGNGKRGFAGDKSVKIRYPADGVMLDYQLTNSGMKEAITLEKPTDLNQFSFPIEFEGVQPQQEPDGSIVGIGSDGTEQLRVEAPSAVDAAGEPAPAVAQSIEQGTDGLSLRLTVDRAWLQDPKRVWPVTIDPTVVIQPDAGDGMDTYFETDGGTAPAYWAYPNAARLFAGSGIDYWASGFRSSVALLKFSLGDVPKGATITSAVLNLYGSFWPIRPVLRDWDNRSASWSFPWSSPGVTQDVGDPINATNNGNWSQYDVTQLMTEWLSGDRPNYGIALGVGAGDRIGFPGSATTNLSNAPYLVVNVLNDITPPSAVLSSPANGSHITGRVDIAATVSDDRPNGIDHVDLSVDDQLLGTWEGAPSAGTVTLSDLTGLPQGSHTVQVTAWDKAGNPGKAQSAFTFDGVPAPDGFSTLGIGGGSIRLSWHPVAQPGYTYRIYRGTTADFTPSTATLVADMVASSPFVDKPPTPGALYFYKLTARAADGTEGSPSSVMGAVSGTAPTMTVALTGNGAYHNLASLYEAGYNPRYPLAPARAEWRGSTSAFQLMGKQDGQVYTSTTSSAQDVKGQRLAFDVLGLVNRERSAMGLPSLAVDDLRNLLTGATVTWVGFAQGANGTTPTYGARLRAWNALSGTWDQDMTSNASSPSSAVLQLTSSQVGAHLDPTGKVQVLADPQYPAQGTIAASVSTDYAYLTLTFLNETPTSITTMASGTGSITLQWKPTALAYTVHRAITSDFTADGSNQIGGPVGTASFVDTTANGLQVNTTYYYKVKAVDANLASQSVSQVADGYPSASTGLVYSYDAAQQTCITPSNGYLYWGSMINIGYQNLPLIARRDGNTWAKSCTSTDQPVETFKFQVAGLLLQQPGYSSTPSSSARQYVESMTFDWTGFAMGSTPADVAIMVNQGGTWQDVTVGLDAQVPQRSTVALPVGSLNSDGTVVVGVRSRTSGSSLYTDLASLSIKYAPQAPQATVDTNGYVNLSWPAAGLFDVFRSTTSGTGYVRVSSAPVASAFTDRTVEWGRSYYYVIRPSAQQDPAGAASLEVKVSVPYVRAENNYTLTPSSGTWYWSSGSYYSGGNLLNPSFCCVDTSYSVSYTFMGTGVSFLASTNPQWGAVDIYVDGAYQGRFSENTASSVDQVRLFTKDDLPSGSHTIKVSYAGAVGSGTSFNVDAFEIHAPMRPVDGISASVSGDRVTLVGRSVAGVSGYHVYQSGTSGSWYGRITRQPSDAVGNLLTPNQSDIESDLGGVNGTNATLVRDSSAGAAWEGTAALKVSVPASSVGGVWLSDRPIQTSKPVVFSTYLRGTGRPVRTHMDFLDANLNVIAASDGDWVNLSSAYGRIVALAQPPANASRVRVTVFTDGVGATATTYWLDGMQLEQGDAVSNWIQGGSLRYSLPFSNADYFVVTGVGDDGRESPISTEITPYAGVGRYDDTSANFRYTGTWVTDTNDRSFATTLHRTYTTGAKATFALSAGGFRVMAEKGPAYGMMEIYRNGTLVTTVDEFAPTRQPKQEVYRLEGLSGLQTLEFRYTGAKNASASSAAINLDAVEVLPGDRPWFLEGTYASAGVNLSWTGTMSAPGGCIVERGTTAGGPYTVLTATPVTGIGFVDTTTAPGITYYYVVQGVTSSGAHTAASNEFIITPARDRAGLDGRWPYVSMPWAGGAAYVELETGDFVTSVTDGLMPAGQLAVALRRTYNSTGPEQHGLGYGWRLNVQQVIIDNGASATWIDGDGSRTVFSRQGDGTYQAEQQAFVTLRQQNGGGWVIQRSDGLKYYFNQAGFMTAVSDRNDKNQISYEVDTSGLVHRIQPTLGTAWTLEYTPSTQLLSKVIDGAGRVYLYSYDSAGNLTGYTDPTGAVTTYDYGSAHQLAKVTDPMGRWESVTYDLGRAVLYSDGLGHATRLAYDTGKAVVTDPLGSQTTFAMNQDGRLTGTTDALGDSTSFKYDSAGNLSERIDPLGRSTKFSDYDGWGHPGTIVDALGNTSQVQYDPVLHLATEIRDPLGRIQSVQYDADGNPIQMISAVATLDEQVIKYTNNDLGQRTSMTDARGHTTHYEYDADNGWLLQIVDPLNGTTRFTYDEAGNLLSGTDPIGRATNYQYDLAGRRIRVTTPGGTSQTFNYDRSGYLVWESDAAGAVTRFEYDAAGQLVARTDALGGTVRYEYDAAGRAVAITDPLGNRTVTLFDAIGRPVAVTDPEGNTTRTTYDAVGNAVRVTLPSGYGMTAEYDALNRQVKTTVPPAESTTQYDAVGNRILTRDGNGHWTRYEYDALNRLLRVYDAMNLDSSGLPVSGAKFTSYQYDKAGNRTAVIDAVGHQTTFVYDQLNRKIQETDPVGVSASLFYDAAGQLVRSVDADGGEATYAYDQRGNLLIVAYGDCCDCLKYEYDSVGRKTSAKSRWGTSMYSYDLLGRVTEEVDPMGNVVHYGYDTAGHVNSLSLREGTWKYAYDRDGRVSTVVDPQGQRTTYAYNADGQVLGVQLPNGRTVDNVYDASSGRLKTRYFNDFSLTYQYDLTGNVTSYSDKNQSVQYKYDAVDRLSQAVVTLNSDPNAPTTTTYTYDDVGNRTKQWVQNPTKGNYWQTVYTYDAANRLTKVVGTTTEQRVYDGKGRLILVQSDSPQRYEYDSFDRLVKVVAGTQVTTYGYDGEGKRTFRKVIDTSDLTKSQAVYYQYAMGQVVAERDAVGAPLDFVTRGAGGELLTLTRPANGTYVFVTDRLGSVLMLAGSSPMYSNSYEYDAFGSATSATENVPNDWKFTGALLDSTTGLYHLGARYYKPADGRFITQDTYKGDPWQPWTQNLYTYVGNNPVNYTDPTGHCFWDACLAEGTLAFEGLAIAGTWVATTAAGVYIGSKVGTWFSSKQNKVKDKNQNSTHETPDEAIQHAKDKVGELGEDKITLLDEDGNAIGEKSVDGSREWRIDDGHVNWKVSEDGVTTGGHAEWTNGQQVPNATTATEQWEMDSSGNLTEVGTPIGGRGR